MNLASITSTDLRRLAKLIEQKEIHLAEIARIDAELAGFGSGQSVARVTRSSSSKVAPKREAKGRKRGARGQLKETIIGLLKEAGKGGLSVKEIATKVGLKPQNVHVWFSATGRKVKEIKKVQPGLYAWIG